MKDFFPRHKLTARPQQNQVLDELEQNWDKYRYFALSLPTGVGKTYISTAVADFTGSAYILTSTLQLQKQYEESWDEIVNLKGRSNYTCNMNPMFTTDFAPCSTSQSLLGWCKRAGKCSYYNQKQAAMDSRAMITNPPYMLYSSHCGFATEEGWQPREVLIIDEAHNLESSLVSFAESEIDIEKLMSDFKIKELGAHRFVGMIDKDIQTLIRVKELLEARFTELDEKAKRAMGRKEGENISQWAREISKESAADAKRLTRVVGALDRTIQPIKIFLESYKPGRWLVVKEQGRNALKLSPVYVDFLFEKYLGKLASKVVFMSATLGSKSEFCKEIGVKEEELLFLETDSPFPPQLSPVVVSPMLSLSKANYQESIKKIGSVVDGILEIHKGQKGIIHCVTYDIQKQVFERVNRESRARLLCRDMEALDQSRRGQQKRWTNEELLGRHASSPLPTVLLSPSMMEGVDLKDDLAKFQIILKMPWANLGDHRVMHKSRVDPDWYANKMWLHVLQASGRSTRHDRDSSITYVLDSSFEWFYGKWRGRLPEWFKRRITKM